MNQDQLRAQRLKRTEAFNLGPRTPAAFQEFALADAEAQRSINDADYADQQAAWADPTHQRGPNSASAFSGPPQKITPAPRSEMGPVNVGYVAATSPQSGTPAHRNNFNGAENAPEGSVVRGLDKLLYRRSGGQFTRIAPRNDMEPPASDAAADYSQNGQPYRFTPPKTNASTYGAFFDPADSEFKTNSTPGRPQATPQSTDDGSRIGAVNNRPTNPGTPSTVNSTLQRNQYEFGLAQDAANDARVRSAATTAGTYMDQNRRSPRFGTRVNWFDPGEVNPAALSRPRRQPAAI